MVKRFENSPSVTLIEVDHIDAEGLFILEDIDAAIAQRLYTLNTGWRAVRDGVPAVVFFNVNGRYIKPGDVAGQVDGFVCAHGIQVICKPSPVVSHQLQFGKTQYN